MRSHAHFIATSAGQFRETSARSPDECSFPRPGGRGVELRTRLGYDGALLGAVSRVFVGSVLGFYGRRMRDLGVFGPDGEKGKSGAVTVVQRTNADLRLNPHLHSAALDGVYVADELGEPVFHPLPELDAMDVADLLQVVRVRILRLLERRGVIEQTDGLTLLPDELSEREPAPAQLAAASVSGLHARRARAPRPTLASHPPEGQRRRRDDGPARRHRAGLLPARRHHRREEGRGRVNPPCWPTYCTVYRSDTLNTRMIRRSRTGRRGNRRP